MDGINNNFSNSNYGSFGNNGSNNPKDEKSIFDNIVDSVKEFFDGDDDNQFSSYNGKSSGYNSNMANIDRAYFNSKAALQSSYTLAPETKKETLGERWAKENEDIKLKQKENEIMQLKQKVGVLENRNKVLASQNEYMSTQMPKNQGPQELVNQTTVATNTIVDDEPEQKQMPKTYDSIPTHTLMSNDRFEKQEKELEEFAQSQKVEEPAEKKDDTEDLENTSFSQQAKA